MIGSELARLEEVAAHGGIPRDRLRVSESLARHTSMRVGGPADLFCEVEDDAELAALIRAARARSIPVFALGGGTNLIVADRGIRGLTVKLGRRLGACEWHDDFECVRVLVGAAANFKRLVLEATSRGLTGLEFGEGIPGTAGGGVLMNAGAFGGEIASVVEAIRGVTGSGEIVRLTAADLRFAYRSLELPQGFLVTTLELRLVADDPRSIAERVAVAKRKRSRHQPLGLPNAGSIFKNPPGDFAGRLIELVGLKGETVGGAQVSPQHANFIVNLGSASADDVKRLMDVIRERVWRQRGVWLEPEVRLVGAW